MQIRVSLELQFAVSLANRNNARLCVIACVIEDITSCMYRACMYICLPNTSTWTHAHTHIYSMYIHTYNMRMHAYPCSHITATSMINLLNSFTKKLLKKKNHPQWSIKEWQIEKKRCTPISLRKRRLKEHRIQWGSLGMKNSDNVRRLPMNLNIYTPSVP